MLDFNKDGTLTPSDLSIFVQQSQGYQCKVGDTVRIRNDPREGTLAYIGATGFADGVWAGINLKEPLGKNNGTVDGKKYFEAKDKHGVFKLILKSYPFFRYLLILPLWSWYDCALVKITFGRINIGKLEKILLNYSGVERKTL